MTVTTVYGTTTDAYIFSYHATTYSTARAGTGSFIVYDTATYINAIAGQQHDGIFGYSCQEYFCNFDTSAITGTVSDATLSLYGAAAYGAGTASTLEVRVQDWGASVTSGDWIAGASISGTIVASKASSGWSNGSYNDMSFSTTAVTTSGTTRLMACNDLTRLGTTQPSTTNSNFTFSGTGESSTTKDPKLVVTWSVSPLFFPQRIITKQASRRASSW